MWYRVVNCAADAELKDGATLSGSPGSVSKSCRAANLISTGLALGRDSKAYDVIVRCIPHARLRLSTIVFQLSNFISYFVITTRSCFYELGVLDMYFSLYRRNVLDAI